MDSVENSIAKGYADFADDNENTVDVTDITADSAARQCDGQRL